MKKSTLTLLLKTAAVLGSLLFIYHTAAQRPDVVRLFTDPLGTIHNTTLFAIATALVILNWGIESLKWHMLVKAVEPISAWQAFLSVMSGTTISLFGPNRTGEFAGRALHVSPGNRIQAAVCTIPGNLAQLLVTLVAGLISLHFVHSPFAYFGMRPDLVFGGLFAVVAVMVMLYFLLPSLRNKLRLTEFFGAVRKYVEPVLTYSSATLVQVLLLSVARYVVFATQFQLMLMACGVEVNVLDAYAAIAVVYLFMAVIPGFALTEFTIRGSVALFLFASLTSNATGVLAASAALWVVNLVLPALIGAVAIYQIQTKS